MNDAIGDQAALIFASSFYRALGFGRSIQEAFDQGRTSLLLEGISEEDTPELLVKTGINPSLIILAKRQLQRKGKDSNKVVIKPAASSDIHSFVQVPKSEPANQMSMSKFKDFVLLRTLHGHTGWVWNVAISPDGQILVSRGNENTIKIWNLLTGQLLHTITEQFGGGNTLTISPDGQILASSFLVGKLWHLSTGELLSTVSLMMDTAKSVAFSPDGQLLTVKDWEDNIMLWHLPTNRLLRSLEGYSSRGYNIEINPDGQTLARGNEDGTITVWDWQSGNLLQTLKGNSPVQYNTNEEMDGRKLAVYNLRFSPDGQILTSRNEDGTISVWNHITGTLLTTFFPPSSIYHIGFSSNGQTLFGKSFKSIVAWYLPSEHLIGSLTGYPDNVSEAISSDGQYIALGNKNGTITIWRKNKSLDH
ncbi:MAG: WD40 repeat domain-containing protein [Ktedonobacteraceae bacterium]